MDCPVCDKDRAAHAEDCPADILAKLAADVAEKTGLEVDTRAWDAMLDEIAKHPTQRVVLCGSPHMPSLAAQIAAIYGDTGVLLLPMEMSQRDIDARIEAMTGKDMTDIVLDSLPTALHDMMREMPRKREYVLRREREVYDDFPIAEVRENVDPRQSYLRLNQAPNRFRGGRKGGHRRRGRS